MYLPIYSGVESEDVQSARFMANASCHGGPALLSYEQRRHLRRPIRSRNEVTRLGKQYARNAKLLKENRFVAIYILPQVVAVFFPFRPSFPFNAWRRRNNRSIPVPSLCSSSILPHPFLPGFSLSISSLYPTRSVFH